MANVFGIPITDKTLKEMPEYINMEITQTDRAHVALNMKNAEDKDLKARTYAEKLKADFGGTGITTRCLIYNATGDPLTFVTFHDYNGHLGDSPYPVQIANGQWGVFLHGQDTVTASGSVGAVVYGVKNQKSEVCDWMLSWLSPGNKKSMDKAYTEIWEAGHSYDWEEVHGNMTEVGGPVFRAEWHNYVSVVAIGGSLSPIYEGTMTLKDA